MSFSSFAQKWRYSLARAGVVAVMFFVVLNSLIPVIPNILSTLAGDNVTSRATVYVGGFDYTANSPAGAPILPLHTAFTVFLDVRNATATPNPLENMVLRNDISGFGGTATCSFISGTDSEDHLALDFDLNGESCTVNTSNDYTIEGATFPNTLTAGSGIYIRLTGLTVTPLSFLSNLYIQGVYDGQSYGPAVDYYYVLAGDHGIAGQVFYDIDNNGLRDGLDYPLSGTTVSLVTQPPSPSAIIGSMLTDAQGYYYFTDNDYPGITPGENYRVTVDGSNIQLITTRNNPQLLPLLGSGKTITSDVGVYQMLPTVIGDRAWNDTNQDGIQDVGEVDGVQGIDLDFYQVLADGDLYLGNATTNSSGAYSTEVYPRIPCRGSVTTFGESTGGVYDNKLCDVVLGGDYYLSFRTDNFCGIDNTAIRLLGADSTVLYEAGCGSRAPDVPGTLANNTVYHVGPFAEIASGTATLSAIEDYGDVSFFDVYWTYTGDMTANVYALYENLPLGLQATLSDQGADDTVDSDIASSSQTNTVTITAGDSFTSLDLGFYDASAQADLLITKEVDENFPEEGDTVNYTIQVNNIGTATASGVVVTDILSENLTWQSDTSLGAYDPNTGIWTVGDVAPSGIESISIAVTVLGTDSIANTATGSTISSESSTDNNVSSVSVHPYTLASLGNYVWEDTDEDGFQDNEGEAGIAGIQVDLLLGSSSTILDTQSTDEDGLYLFTGLVAGDYRVMFTLPDNAHFTSKNSSGDINTDSDADEETGISDVVTIGLNEINDTIDAGIVLDPAEEGRLLFHLFTDTDGDGIQDSGEPDGYNNAVIHITHDVFDDETVVVDENGDIDSAIAASDTPYTLEIDVPSGRSITGGDHPIENILIIADETTDVGSRGVYRARSRSGGGGGGGVNWGNVGSGNSDSSGSWVRGDGSRSRSNNNNDRNTLRTNTLFDSVSCLTLGGSEALQFTDTVNTSIAPDTQFLTTILSNLSNNRIIKGYGNGEFGIAQPLTRFELTKIAVESNCVTSNGYVPNQTFPDVPQDDSEMSLIVGTATQLGIVQGFNGKFYPQQPVTVGEMMKILLSSNAALKAHIYTMTFSDVPGLVQADFKPFGAYGYQIGMVRLVNDEFPQNRPVLRYEMASALATYIRYLKSLDS